MVYFSFKSIHPRDVDRIHVALCKHLKYCSIAFLHICMLFLCNYHVIVELNADNKIKRQNIQDTGSTVCQQLGHNVWNLDGFNKKPYFMVLNDRMSVQQIICFSMPDN